MIVANDRLELEFSLSGALTHLRYDGREMLSEYCDGRLFELNFRDGAGNAVRVVSGDFAPPCIEGGKRGAELRFDGCPAHPGLGVGGPGRARGAAGG